MKHPAPYMAMAVTLTLALTAPLAGTARATTTATQQAATQASQQTASQAPAQQATQQATQQRPPLPQRPRKGTVWTSADRRLQLTLADRRQAYNATDAATYTREILSPKSVNIHPGGKAYVNSLEGGTTVVFTPRRTVHKVIAHRFTGRDTSLWAPLTPLTPFTHYTGGQRRGFMGKPVEACFTHGSRYLWVPYYRRSFDTNAQDPSALAVIDTTTDSIVRMLDTGPLPKMVCASPDGSLLAVTQWGDNTVTLYDIHSRNPREWKIDGIVTIDRRLQLNYPLDTPVDRDRGSGLALRGTTFTPDGRYLLVTGMSDSRLHVIDVASRRRVAALQGLHGNMRHLTVHGDTLWTSCNLHGIVQAVALKEIYDAMEQGNRAITGSRQVKVGRGARTISMSPDGSLLAVVSNSECLLQLIDTRTMQVVLKATTDPFPVGLDYSPDGRTLWVTCQGHAGPGGGNCVDIFTLSVKS